MHALPAMLNKSRLTTDLCSNFVVRQTCGREDGEFLSSGDGVHAIDCGDSCLDHFLRVDAGVGVDCGAVDVEVIFGKDTGAVVDGDARAVEDSAEHVFGDRDAEIVASELNGRLLHIDA